MLLAPRARDRSFVAACVAAMILGLATIAQADPLDRRIDPDALELDLLVEGIAEASQAARAAAGLRALPRSPALERAAMEHAARMAELGFYDHTDPFDPAHRSPGDRARRAGLANPITAENIHDFGVLEHGGGPVYPLGGRGRFSLDPDGAPIPTRTYRGFGVAVVDEWLASPGHRRNLLDPDATAIGLGAALHWQDGDWPHLKAVQLFQLHEAPREAAAAIDGAAAAPPVPAAEAPALDARFEDAAPPRRPRRDRRAARRAHRWRLTPHTTTAPAAPVARCDRPASPSAGLRAPSRSYPYEIEIDGVRYRVDLADE